MKKITLFYVQTVMDNLIITNGQTTTLDVKNSLRNMDFFAEQAQVKEFMDCIYDTDVNKYKRTQTGQFFTYSFIEEAEEIDDDDDDDDVTIDRDPLQIFYTKTQLKNNLSHINDNSWVVFNTNGNCEYHIYHADLTRDNVRSKYAMLNNVKIQDVRSKRYSNFIK